MVVPTHREWIELFLLKKYVLESISSGLGYSSQEKNTILFKRHDVNFTYF